MKAKIRIFNIRRIKNYILIKQMKISKIEKKNTFNVQCAINLQSIIKNQMCVKITNVKVIMRDI